MQSIAEVEGTAEVDIPDWNTPGNPVDILEEIHDDSSVLDQEEVGNQEEVVVDKGNQVQGGPDTLEVGMGKGVYSLVADNPPPFLYCSGSSWFGSCYRYRRSVQRMPRCQHNIYYSSRFKFVALGSENLPEKISKM